MGRGGQQPLPTKNWKTLAPLRHGKEQMCSPYPAEVLAQLKQNKHSNVKLPDVKVRIKTPAKISIPLPQVLIPTSPRRCAVCSPDSPGCATRFQMKVLDIGHFLLIGRRCCRECRFLIPFRCTFCVMPRSDLDYRVASGEMRASTSRAPRREARCRCAHGLVSNAPAFNCHRTARLEERQEQSRRSVLLILGVPSQR